MTTDTLPFLLVYSYLPTTQVIADKDLVIQRLQSDKASAVKITKAEAAQELASVSSSLAAKADAAEKEAWQVLAKQKTTVQAERAVTSHTIASVKAKHQAAILQKEKESEQIIADNKQEAADLLQQNEDLRQSLTEQEVQSKSTQRDIKKDLNKIIDEKNKMLKTATKEASIAHQETKRLSHDIAKETGLSTKRQKMLDTTAATVAVLSDGLVTVETTMQTQLDAALLSVGALRTENADLHSKIFQLEHDCAEAVVELEVSLYVF